jgi:hypothetical protein
VDAKREMNEKAARRMLIRQFTQFKYRFDKESLVEDDEAAPSDRSAPEG